MLTVPRILCIVAAKEVDFQQEPMPLLITSALICPKNINNMYILMEYFYNTKRTIMVCFSFRADLCVGPIKSSKIDLNRHSGPLSSKCSIVAKSQCRYSNGECNIEHDDNCVSKKLNVTPDGRESVLEFDAWAFCREDNGNDSGAFVISPAPTRLNGSLGFDNKTLLKITN